MSHPWPTPMRKALVLLILVVLALAGLAAADLQDLTGYLVTADEDPEVGDTVTVDVHLREFGEVPTTPWEVVLVDPRNPADVFPMTPVAPGQWRAEITTVPDHITLFMFAGRNGSFGIQPLDTLRIQPDPYTLHITPQVVGTLEATTSASWGLESPDPFTVHPNILPAAIPYALDEVAPDTFELERFVPLDPKGGFYVHLGDPTVLRILPFDSLDYVVWQQLEGDRAIATCVVDGRGAGVTDLDLRMPAADASVTALGLNVTVTTGADGCAEHDALRLWQDLVRPDDPAPGVSIGFAPPPYLIHDDLGYELVVALPPADIAAEDLITIRADQGTLYSPFHPGYVDLEEGQQARLFGTDLYAVPISGSGTQDVVVIHPDGLRAMVKVSMPDPSSPIQADLQDLHLGENHLTLDLPADLDLLDLSLNVIVRGEDGHIEWWNGGGRDARPGGIPITARDTGTGWEVSFSLPEFLPDPFEATYELWLYPVVSDGGPATIHPLVLESGPELVETDAKSILVLILTPFVILVVVIGLFWLFKKA